MLPFWTLFAIPASVLLFNRRFTSKERWLPLFFVCLLFGLIIGFRDRVGGDWNNYLHHFEALRTFTFDQLLYLFEVGYDPGYYFLNWLLGQVNGTIYLLNLLCGLIFMSGVMIFCRKQPLPWLALLVAVPYLIIVVGMGYVRQAVALGICMIALVQLSNRHLVKFILFVAIGATFHKSAVLLLPIAAFVQSQNRILSLIFLVLTGIVGFYVFLASTAENMWENYVEADYSSQGGLIRVLMNAVPAILYILYREKLSESEQDKKLWTVLSVASLVCIPLVLLSSTATDRVALYMIPLQLYIFSRIPLITRKPDVRGYLVLGVIAYYFFVQYVWLNYAAHAYRWIPYSANISLFE